MDLYCACSFTFFTNDTISQGERVMQVAVRSQQMLESTVNGLQASLNQHMPPGPPRDYLSWGISRDNPDQQFFLQTIGLLQLVNLTATLLDDLVDDALWDQLTDYTIYMNVYQIYEIVSDNLAIGLGRPARDAQTQFQRTLLSAFNSAMIERLRHNPMPTTQMLEPLRPYTSAVSCFGQSLNREKHLQCAEPYLVERPEVSLRDLEFGMWPVLVANIESCVELANLLQDYHTGTLLREGLINRYWAVTRTLEARNAPLLELAAIGAHSILVWPTLGYYTAVLGEILSPNDAYPSLIEDGTLAEALYTAALLVRLLNDLGTGLLRQTDEQREQLVDVLWANYLKNSDTLNSISLLLLSDVDMPERLTRIHKDLFHGEFNVALHTVRQIRSVPDAIRVFGENLAYFSHLYAAQFARLEELLAIITTRLQDQTISTLIGRFVFFHEKLYSHRYTAQAGEYAI